MLHRGVCECGGNVWQEGTLWESCSSLVFWTILKRFFIYTVCSHKSQAAAFLCPVFWIGFVCLLLTALTSSTPPSHTTTARRSHLTVSVRRFYQEYFTNQSGWAWFDLNVGCILTTDTLRMGWITSIWSKMLVKWTENQCLLVRLVSLTKTQSPGKL